MSFISYEFLLCLLPLTALFVALARKRNLQNAVLAVASMLFYAGFGAAGLTILLLCTAVTYACGRAGHELTARGDAAAGKRVYAAGLALDFLPLLLFKYGDFAAENANRVLGRLGLSLPLPGWLLPVGLSFFVFQSATYLFDLYRGKIEPEKNFINYLLFVAFFPTVTSGPIQRASALLPQIAGRDRVSLERVQRAAVLFAWGAFVKLVLADRLNVFTDAVFQMYARYSGLVLLAGAVAYSVQIYADFLAYSAMAIAVASMFGFDLPENFRQPYLATDIASFWRRWHISLTSWLTDYIYIPLGGSRRGALRRYVNILIVFLVSGLWHGAAWRFVIWGALHALFQIAGHMSRPAREALCARLRIDRGTRAYRCWQRACVFALVALAWIFFRIGSTHAAIDYIARMAAFNPWVLTDGTFAALGLTAGDWGAVLVSGAVLLCVSLCREKGVRLAGGMPVRLLVFLLLLCATMLFGRYGATYDASAFIYASF